VATEAALRLVSCGSCPYLEGREWEIEEFSVRELEPAIYEELLASGFRRSGMSFYRNLCPNCGLCIPIRLDARDYEPTKSLRRLARLNSDLEVTLVPASYSEERFELYSRYVEARHEKEVCPPKEARASYSAFLLESPFASTMITEYRLPSGRLAATGYVDLLPEGISSVYFAFDPELGKRSIGTWSVLRELELAAAIGKRWYYLGFWVPGSPKMDYKARFHPFEYAYGGAWTRVSDKAELLSAMGAA
jgi:arginine-tRNA-protein transferase